MENIVEFVKNNKIKLIIAVIIVILLGICIHIYLNSKNRKYELTEISTYNYYQLNKDGKYGIIDSYGNIVIEPIYDSVKIPNPEKAVFICEQSEEKVVLNDKNEKIFNEYEEVSEIQINGIVTNVPYEKDVLKYKQNGKYGLINFNGKKITKPIYEEINGLENKESELLVKNNQKYGVINSKGAKLIKENYDDVQADGYYTDENKYGKSGYIVGNKTESGYRYGYINYKLKKVLEVEYNEITRIQGVTDTNDIYLIASKNGKYGVQKNNKTLINYSYQGIDFDGNNKIFEIQRNSKYGIFNINGKEILPIEYEEIEVNGTYIQGRKGDEIKLFSIYGDEINDSQYTTMITAGENYYITIDNIGNYGIADKQQNNLVENKYNYIEYLFEDYFIALPQEGKLGIIDSHNNKIVDFKYDVLQKIADTTIIEGKILKENLSDIYSGQIEQINSDNNVAVYKEDNYIVVHSQYSTKYFDINGNKVNAKDIFKNNKLFAIERDNKWGYEDASGNIVVDYQYDKVTEFNEKGFAGIKKDNKWGIINQEGKVIVEPIYHIEENNRDPEFLGKFYKVYYGYGEVYYTDQINAE